MIEADTTVKAYLATINETREEYTRKKALMKARMDANKNSTLM